MMAKWSNSAARSGDAAETHPTGARSKPHCTGFQPPAVPAEARLYDRLFNVEAKPRCGIVDNINPESLQVVSPVYPTGAGRSPSR